MAMRKWLRSLMRVPLGEELMVLLEKMHDVGASEDFQEVTRLNIRINIFLERNGRLLSWPQLWALQRGLVQMNQQRIRANMMAIVMDTEDDSNSDKHFIISRAAANIPARTPGIYATIKHPAHWHSKHANDRF